MKTSITDFKKRERDLCAGRFCLSANCLSGPLCIKKILSWFGLLSKNPPRYGTWERIPANEEKPVLPREVRGPPERSHSRKQMSAVDHYCCKIELFAHCGCGRFASMLSALTFRGGKIPLRSRKKTTADGSVYIFMTCW